LKLNELLVYEPSKTDTLVIIKKTVFIDLCRM